MTAAEEEEFSKVCEEIAEINALIREHRRRWIEEFLKERDGRGD